MNSAFAVQLLLEHYPIITLDGERVHISPQNDDFHFWIDVIGTDRRHYVDRGRLLKMCGSGKLKFYQEAHIDSELQAALYDYD
jgi:hypothetical protein